MCTLICAGSLFHLLTAIKVVSVRLSTNCRTYYSHSSIATQVDTYHPWNVNLTLHLLHETVQDESVAHFL